MAIETLYPAIRPSLNLDFAGSKTLDPRITFSRASAATYYDGKTVAKVEENLLTYSQDFGNSVWAKSSSTVIPDSITAPDGANTADTLLASAGVVSPALLNAYNQVSTLPHVVSFFAKAGTHSFIQYTNNYGASTFVNFNLATGQVGTKGASVTEAVMIPFGNGWYRCVLSISTLQFTHLRLVQSSSASYGETFAATGTESVHLWGAQLEQRSQVTAYTPTTTQPITNYIPVLQTAPAGVPRFDHNPVTGESLGLLVEEQRTNLLTYSEQFDTGGWTKIASSVLMNAAVAPDGSISADKLVADSAATSHRTEKSFTVVQNTAYCFSIYVKAGEHKGVSLNCAGGSSWAAFNLQTGTVNGSGGTGDASGVIGRISPIGNGWYRCNLSFTWVGTDVATSFRIASSDSATVNTSQAAFIGDGYSGIYTWGAQLEAGAFPTSYIKTEASQVTRAADSASMVGANFSSWYRQDEGTFFSNAEVPANPSGTNFEFFNVSDGSANGTNSLISRVNNGSMRVMNYGTYQGAPQFTLLDGKSFSIGDFAKISLAYKLNDVAACVASGSPLTDTGFNQPLVNSLFIGGFAQRLNGHIKRIAYYPKRLTDAQLQALTA